MGASKRVNLGSKPRLASRDSACYKSILMASKLTHTVQLAMPLGADVIWADVAVQENGRSEPALNAEIETDIAFRPIDQWRQQSVQQDASLNDVLVDGQLYTADGGIFKARQEDGRWELWVWQGRNGNDAGTRTGFEVDGAGNLYERLYDLDAEEFLVMAPARFEVADLKPYQPELEIIASRERTRILDQHIGS